MRKEYRLINDFKKQTETTIWKHLDAMAVNYAVYSSHLKGLAPYLTDFDVYLYCDNSSMVVVCLDCCGHCEEQTYEESETLSPLILSDDHEPRVSKVWKLAQTVRAINNRLMIPVYGVLITEADITNAYELDEMWDSNNVTVIDYMKRLKYRKIRVNEDENLDCKSYVYTLNETPLHAMIAVVLCGYKEPMQKLIDLNPGLQSRFPNKFEFPDFTIDELLEITKFRIKEYNYTFTTEAWEKYVSILSSAYQTRDPQTWGNARFIGNQLERIYIQHASRCVKQQLSGKSELLSLTPEDIIPIEVPRLKTKIGF